MIDVGPGRPPRRDRREGPGRRERRGRGERERGSRRGGLWLGLLLLMVLVLGGVMLREAAKDDDPAPVQTAPPSTRLLQREGLRREEVAALLDRETLLSGERYLQVTAPGARGRALARTSRPASLEGFLFPATYDIGPETTVESLIDEQLQAYARNTASIDYRFAASRNLTRYDVLIIASMVEREVQVPGERRIVASVIYNRLRRGMKLDIDATVQYALGDWRTELSADDLAVSSPYNTRRFTGLPPGPICSPGAASIAAAARPAQTSYLYYVARNDGTGRHYFTASLEQFQSLVERAREEGG